MRPRRRWEAFGQRDDLERSLNYYRLGHAASQPEKPSYDFGWNAINEAYLLDLLDDLDHTQARQQKQPPAANVAAVGEQANQSRHDLARHSARNCQDATEGCGGIRCGWVKSEWWYHATLAEAHLGLDDYGAAATLGHKKGWTPIARQINRTCPFGSRKVRLGSCSIWNG